MKQFRINNEIPSLITYASNTLPLFRVTCHADGWPQPDAFITSTLLGGEIKNLTVPSGASFLYSRPVSLFGPLGSIGCSAKNELGTVVSTDTVEISASRE